MFVRVNPCSVEFDRRVFFCCFGEWAKCPKPPKPFYGVGIEFGVNNLADTLKTLSSRLCMAESIPDRITALVVGEGSAPLGRVPRFYKAYACDMGSCAIYILLDGFVAVLSCF